MNEKKQNKNKKTNKAVTNEFKDNVSNNDWTL